MTMKRISPQGARATWLPLAVVAPLAAVIFLGSVGFSASVKQSDLIPTKPVANVQLVSAAKLQQSTVSKLKPTAQTKTKRSSAPVVHALTRASGA